MTPSPLKKLVTLPKCTSVYFTGGIIVLKVGEHRLRRISDHKQNQTLSRCKSASWRMDPDLPAIRRMMIEILFSYFQRQPKYPSWQQKVPAVVMKIERKLFKDSSTKEEYMDPSTLEHRLHVIITSTRAQRQRANSSIPRTSNAVLSSPPVHKILQASVPLRNHTEQASGLTEQQQLFGENMLSSPIRLNPACQYQQLGPRNSNLDSDTSYHIRHPMDTYAEPSVIHYPPFLSSAGDHTLVPSENEMGLVHGPEPTLNHYLNPSIHAESPFQTTTSLERDWSMKDSETPSTHMPIWHNIPAVGSSFQENSQGMMEPQITPKRILHHDDFPEIELPLQKCSPCMMESETLPPIEGLGQLEQQSPSETFPVSHQSKEAVGENMLRRSKFTAVSLTESFTAEQIREHIQSLRQCSGQTKLEGGNVQVMGNSMDKDSCTLCGGMQLWLEPPPIYCSLSNDRIKCNEVFYTRENGEQQFYLCSKCHSSQSKIFKVGGVSVLKAHLKKQKNLAQIGEEWVQCDKCKAWQHQICALFNPKRNLGEETEYTCPNCCLREIETGGRKPLPEHTFLGAKDLPRTALSNHIEDHLFRKLKEERQQRANQLGKNFDEVECAEGLVLRVVSCIDKKVKVKSRFKDLFNKDEYPSEFPYKFKVIMLFQKLEGVDVCLFTMHTQEFGSDCPLPNKGRVYISYIDSVRYFRPEIKLVNGEALRTFVYHEILVGYLDYCKKQGFVSIHIWSSPPRKGDNYILYCRPKMQRLPRSPQLRQWYETFLKKAINEGIVAEWTNAFNSYFMSSAKCKTTAVCLPYFAGDYFPDLIEETLYFLQKEKDDQKEEQRGRKRTSRRSLKATDSIDLCNNSTLDTLLMQKLTDKINEGKEELIIANLQYSCAHCCQFIVSGNRWTCDKQKVHLCQGCFDVDQEFRLSGKCPTKINQKHSFSAVKVNNLPSNTKDEDETIGCHISETRQMFLNFCQVNNLQFDTLRRAKYSSMMLLYHLHNPSIPIFMSNCAVCVHEIKKEECWRCEICPGYNVCNDCYQREGSVEHIHELRCQLSMDDYDVDIRRAQKKHSA